jgi:Flp pilus assembly protein CpaB
MEGLTLARGNRGLLLIAMSAGLIAAILVFVGIAQRDSSGGSTESSTAVATIPTVVAAQTIAVGTEIKADMVRLAYLPEDVHVSGAFDDTALVVGEVTNVAIEENDQLTPAKVGPLVEGNGLSGVVPPRLRAVALRVEEVTAVGGNLLPGDRVDVIAVYETPERVVSTTILQNIEVLSVAQEAQIPLPAGQADTDGDGTPDVSTSGQLPEDVKEQPSATTVTLAVNPEQAQMLFYAQEEAIKVYTSLRSQGDQEPVELAPVDAIRPR